MCRFEINSSHRLFTMLNCNFACNYFFVISTKLSSITWDPFLVVNLELSIIFFRTSRAVNAVPIIIVPTKILIPIGPVRANDGTTKAKENRATFKAPLVKTGITAFLALNFILSLLIYKGNKHYFCSKAVVLSPLWNSTIISLRNFDRNAWWSDRYD